MLDEQEIRSLLLRTAARDAGSADAFERLYKKCAPLLMGVAKRVVGRAEVAEEVLHDSFARIWRSAGTYDPLAGQPLAWMVTIVRNRAIDVRASHDVSHVRSYHDDASEGPDGGLDRIFQWSSTDPGEAEDHRRALRWLRECLSHLQAVERQAIVLAYQHGLSHGELATHLGRPLGTVKTWVRRATAHLRECVESRMGSAP